MEEKQKTMSIPLTIIQSNGEKKDFSSVSAASKFCDVNTHTIFYAFKKGKNRFTRRKDKVSFEVYETAKPSFSQMPWGMKKTLCFSPFME